MKRIGFIVCFLLSYLLHAQNVEVDLQWGEVLSQKGKKGTESLLVLGYDEAAYYGRYTSTLEYVMRYNRNGKGVKTNHLSYTDQNGEHKPEFVTMCKSEIYIFSSLQNKKDKKYYLFVQQLNKQDLHLIPALKKIAEVGYEDIKEPLINFSIGFSNDSSKILIKNSLFNKKEKNKALKRGFTVLDKDFTTIWGKENFLPEAADIFEVDQMLVGNDADVYILGKTFAQQDDNRVGEKALKNTMEQQPNTVSTANYRVIHYAQSKKEPVVSPLIHPEQGLRIDNMAIAINNNSEVIGCGVVALEGQISARGVYSVCFDKTTKQIKNTSSKEFSTDFITKALPAKESADIIEKWKAKEEFENFEYKIRDIHFKKDGGFILVVEKYEHYVFIPTDGRTTTPTDINIFGDIIIVNCEVDSKIKWIQKVPKSQKSEAVGEFMGSFAWAFNGADDVFFFYNSIWESSLAVYGNGFKKATFVAVKIAEDGKESRKEIFSAKTTNNIMRPREFVQTADNEVIIFGQKKLTGTARYLKLTFR